ncbi:hypothetical protein VTI74DRAFT_728 [Chaetomium olivicolor]
MWNLLWPFIEALVSLQVQDARLFSDQGKPPPKITSHTCFGIFPRETTKHASSRVHKHQTSLDYWPRALESSHHLAGSGRFQLAFFNFGNRQWRRTPAGQGGRHRTDHGGLRLGRPPVRRCRQKSPHHLSGSTPHPTPRTDNLRSSL